MIVEPADKARVIERIQKLAESYILGQPVERRRALMDADIDYTFADEGAGCRIRADAMLDDGPERLADVPIEVIGGRVEGDRFILEM